MYDVPRSIEMTNGGFHMQMRGRGDGGGRAGVGLGDERGSDDVARYLAAGFASLSVGDALE